MTIDVASLQQGIGFHRGLEGRVLAVQFDEYICCSVDVDVIGQ